MFSDVSSCRSHIASLASVSVVYATYLPFGVIAVCKRPLVENGSDLNGVDSKGAESRGADDPRVADLMAMNQKAVTRLAVARTAKATSAR